MKLPKYTNSKPVSVNLFWQAYHKLDPHPFLVPPSVVLPLPELLLCFLLYLQLPAASLICCLPQTEAAYAT